MTKITVVRGRQMNKIICLFMAVIAAICLIAAGVIYLAVRNQALTFTMLVMAAIFAFFSLLYGLFWLYYGIKEGKQQEKYARIYEEMVPVDESDVYGNWKFILPRERLIRGARNRFLKILAGLLITAVLLFAVMYGSMIRAMGYQGARHLFFVIMFCLVIPLPGLVIQFGIYRRFASAVPKVIYLYPGKIYVDRQTFHVSRIKQVSINVEQIVNLSAVSLYRKLRIQTDEGQAVYTIDYRAPGNPQWENYPEFVENLRSWAQLNRVALKIDFMD